MITTPGNGLSPDGWQKLVKLLISAVGPVAQLLDAIARLLH
jgi:hypothetical protein